MVANGKLEIKFMSDYIWGKLKLKEKIIFNNYQRNNILVYFTDKKNSLFQCDLEENEIYFNIACGYNQMVDLSIYEEQYLNCEVSYFFLNAPKKTKNLNLYFESLYSRIINLQDVINEIYNNENVEKITYFHADENDENLIDEYKLVDWKLEAFADKFFIATILNMGFTPTIKVVFKK